MQDNILPAGKWVFDSAVTDVFEDMLRRSIPDYDNMRRLVFDIASRYVQPKTAIVDLGCSRGDALAPLVDRFGAQNFFVGVEVSEPMLAIARRAPIGVRPGMGGRRYWCMPARHSTP